MNLQDLSEEKSNQNDSKVNLPNKKIIYIAAALAALVIIVGGFTMYQNVQETNSKITTTIEAIEEYADNLTSSSIAYPTPSSRRYMEYIWGVGGYFDQLRDNQKLTKALIAAMEDVCTSTDKETGEAKFRYQGLDDAYAMAAVLEYMDYENTEVKTCLDSLTTQALAAAEESQNFSTTRSIYNSLLRFKGLTYYTGVSEQLPNEQIEAVYLAQWQEVKQEMSSGKASLDSFLEEVAEIINKSPTSVPERSTAKADDTGSSTTVTAGSSMASAVNGTHIPKTGLDVNKMAPQAEILAALQEYGEAAIFRNGQGGYYDFSTEKGTMYKEKGTKYGDFMSVFISGRAKRTGNEDEFTESYLRQHYDNPDKTYYYFKGETIGALPSFFSDTTHVFVYNDEVFAFTDYAIYYRSDCLPYDYEKAKDMEFKHVSLNEEEYLQNEMEQTIRPYLQELRNFSPRYDYSVENNLLTIYLTALPGTTAALQAGESIPFSQQDDSKLEWGKFSSYLSSIYNQMKYTVGEVNANKLSTTGDDIGIGIIVISDVNPDAGLLSMLNGEVVQDNSSNPPESASTAPTAPEEE